VKTYRVLVGPWIFVEFSVHGAMTQAQEAQLLGEYLIEAVAQGHRTYGPGHEVRVSSYIRSNG
jgi:hypothetical protein